MATPIYRPYTLEEITAAARKHNIDPAWLEAIYAKESSRGTDPRAMGVQTVKRARDTTMVRGPFQLEDGTVDDYKRKNKLANLDISDPDQYIDVAAGIAADKLRQARGDYGLASERYLGRGQDQFGTTTGAYRNRIMQEMAAIKARDNASEAVSSFMLTPPMSSPEAVPPTSLPSLPPMAGLTIGGGSDDLFGMPDNIATGHGSSSIGSWSDFLADARGGRGRVAPLPTEPMRGDFPEGLYAGEVGLGIPPEMGGDLPSLEPATPFDTDKYIASMVDQQMDNRDFSDAA